MRPIRVLLLLVCSSACGGRGAPGVDQAADSAGSTDPELLAPPRAWPPIPEYPAARRLHLVAVSAGGTDTLLGSWPARAAACDEPPALQVLAQSQDVGTLILLHLAQPIPDQSSYPVAVPDSGFPSPPAAQVAAQLTMPGSVRAFQAVNGTVELTALDATVSGRFAVTLRETESQDSLRYVGVFEGIPIGRAAAADCAAMAGTEDQAAPSANAR